MDININTFEQLQNLCISLNRKIYEIAQEKMAHEADITVDEVRAFASRSLFAMKEALQLT